jgi:predicted Fe-Mo cluster-binding NifX family protein
MFKILLDRTWVNNYFEHTFISNQFRTIFNKRKITIMRKGRIAIPSVEKGGLDGQRSSHFGHCDVFTLIDVEEGKIKQVTTIQNQGHVHGGCMAPVNLLAENNVNALIVGGIGMRPLMGFKQAGINVYHDDTRIDIRPVVEDLVAGKLAIISDHQVCGGGGQCA